MGNMHDRMAARNSHFVASSASSTQDGFLPSRHVRERYRVSDMTIWRWLRDDKLGFPQPVYISRYRYWKLADLEAWEASQAKKGAAA